MRWASDILWYIARQSSVISMTNGGFVSEVQARSFLWFYWCCAKNQKIELQLPGEKELLPENSVKAWYQYNWGVYGEKEFTSNTQRALQTSACSSCEVECLLCGIPKRVKLTANLYLFYFIFQVLRCQGCIFKPLFSCHIRNTLSLQIAWSI